MSTTLAVILATTLAALLTVGIWLLAPRRTDPLPPPLSRGDCGHRTDIRVVVTDHADSDWPSTWLVCPACARARAATEARTR